MAVFPSASSKENGIRESTDSGMTWNAGLLPPSLDSWRAVTVSADGSLVLAASDKAVWRFGMWWKLAGDWVAVASSADGTRLLAAEKNGRLHTSADAGKTWQARDEARNWSAVASSADGKKLVATVLTGQVFTSSDAGETWVRMTSGRAEWSAVASSSDGSKLVGSIYGATLETSTNASLERTTALAGSAGASVRFLYAGGGSFMAMGCSGGLFAH